MAFFLPLSAIIHVFYIGIKNYKKIYLVNVESGFLFFLWQILTERDNSSSFLKPLPQEKAAHNEAGYFFNCVRLSSFNSRKTAKMYTWIK